MTPAWITWNAHVWYKFENMGENKLYSSSLKFLRSLNTTQKSIQKCLIGISVLGEYYRILPLVHTYITLAQTLLWQWNIDADADVVGSGNGYGGEWGFCPQIFFLFAVLWAGVILYYHAPSPAQTQPPKLRLNRKTGTFKWSDICHNIIYF